MKLNKLLGAFTALTFLAVPACDDKKEDKKEDAKKDDAKKDDKKDEKADEKADEKKDDDEEDGDDDGGGGADKIGIAECDDFVEKWSACIDKMPEESRGAQREAIKTSLDAWKAAADTPAKDTLADACTQMLEATKSANEAFGCEW